MEVEEIKKMLYKLAPTAHFWRIRQGIAYYRVDIELTTFGFEVPVNDMGDATFEREMPAKHLIRWLRV